jgi:hypothetical protein
MKNESKPLTGSSVTIQELQVTWCTVKLATDRINSIFKKENRPIYQLKIAECLCNLSDCESILADLVALYENKPGCKSAEVMALRSSWQSLRDSLKT